MGRSAVTLGSSSTTVWARPGRLSAAHEGEATMRPASSTPERLIQVRAGSPGKVVARSATGTQQPIIPVKSSACTVVWGENHIVLGRKKQPRWGPEGVFIHPILECDSGGRLCTGQLQHGLRVLAKVPAAPCPLCCKTTSTDAFSSHLIASSLAPTTCGLTYLSSPHPNPT